MVALPAVIVKLSRVAAVRKLPLDNLRARKSRFEVRLQLFLRAADHSGGRFACARQIFAYLALQSSGVYNFRLVLVPALRGTLPRCLLGVTAALKSRWIRSGVRFASAAPQLFYVPRHFTAGVVMFIVEMRAPAPCRHCIRYSHMFRLRTSATRFICVACGIDTATTADGKCHCWGYSRHSLSSDRRAAA